MQTKAKKIGALGKRLGLSKNEVLALSALISKAAEFEPDVEIKLFGSKATGTSDEESDIDVLLTIPKPVTEENRAEIIRMVFEINLEHGTNISPLIVTKMEWESELYSLLPIHAFIEEEGVPL